MASTLEQLQDMRDRAMRVHEWVQQIWDDQKLRTFYCVDHTERVIAESWFYNFELFASEYTGASWLPNPEQHRQAVVAMAELRLEGLAAFRALEVVYLTARENTARAVNSLLVAASGGVED
jgi:hypothetical protein